MTTVLTGKKWNAYKKITEDVDGFTLPDVKANAFGDAFITLGAARVTNFDLGPAEFDDCYRIVNQPFPKGELIGFHIHDIVGTNLKRGGIRLKQAKDGLIENVAVHQTGEGFKVLPAGFALSHVPASNIVYRNCEAADFFQIVPAGKYKNGDGFSDEAKNDHITYEDCRAVNNGDGGFDCKSTNLKMDRCLADGNKRNFRMWGGPGMLTDCISSNPHQVHFWFGGDARTSIFTLLRPVFIGGPDKPHVQIYAGTADDVITIIDPVLPPGETLRIDQRDTGKLAKVKVVSSKDLDKATV